MILAVYSIGQRLSDAERQLNITEAAIMYATLRADKRYKCVRSMIDYDVLEIHAEEVIDDGLQSDSRQYRDAVCDVLGTAGA